MANKGELFDLFVQLRLTGLPPNEAYALAVEMQKPKADKEVRSCSSR